VARDHKDSEAPALLLTAPRSELGGTIAAAGNTTRSGGSEAPRVLLSIAAQPPNTLLHDGHAWKRHTPAQILSNARSAVRAARAADAGFIVHASYAFLRAVEGGSEAGRLLRPIVDAAVEAEGIVLAAGLPACIVRLGYLYGPQCKDLRAYRLAFRIGRPYWAGSPRRLQHFLHMDDAARALLLAASRAQTGRVMYATDDQPASFAAFMDFFARRAGNPIPLHLPAASRMLSHLVVSEAHMEMVDIGVRGPATPSLPGFRPRFADYRAGLEQVIAAWH
jgi:hypothetical protein